MIRLFRDLLVGLALVGALGWAADRWLPGSQESRQFLVSVVGTLLFQAAALALIGRFLRENQQSWGAAFGWTQLAWRPALVAAVLTVLAVFPVALSLMWVSQRLMEWQSIQPVAQPAVETLRTTSLIERRVLLGVLAILTAPVVEEVLFRGVFYPALKQFGLPRFALWGTALVFAMIHANLMTFLPLTFFAVVLTLLYERTGNLLAPVLAHALFNAGNFLWLLVG